MFYVDDPFNGPNWKVVEHFGHRYIWDFLEEDASDITVFQDIESQNIELVVELPKIVTLIFNRTDVEPNVVTSNVDVNLRHKSPVEDDFMTTRVMKLYLTISKMRSLSMKMMMT